MNGLVDEGRTGEEGVCGATDHSRYRQTESVKELGRAVAVPDVTVGIAVDHPEWNRVILKGRRINTDSGPT